MSIKHFIGFSAALVALGYFTVENRQLETTEYTVKCPKLPDEFVGKKILLISDLHNKRYGENFNNLMNSCIAVEPDYIFFTGDLYSKDETELLPKAALMKRLCDVAPLYYILGNHEIRNMDNCEALCYKLESMGVHVLRNAVEKLYCGDSFVNIYGTQLPISYYVNRDGTYDNLPELTENELEKLVGECDKTQFNILLSHNPLFMDTYSEWGADLVFAGHCHGGIVRLPLIGGILSPERKFMPKYTKGVYKKTDTQMIVTAGLGKFRVNNPSEIVVVTLSR